MFRLILLLGLAIPAIGFLANLEDQAAGSPSYNVDYASTAADRPGTFHTQTNDRYAGGAAPGRPDGREHHSLAALKLQRDRAYAQFRSIARAYGPYSTEASEALSAYRQLDQAYRQARR